VDKTAYIINRLLQMIPLAFILTILVFLMVHAIPGDPVITMLGVEAEPDKVAALNEHLGLDKPLPVQFGIFLNNLAHGDLGESILVRVPVMQMIRQRLPVTLFIVGYAMVIAVLLTFPLSLLAAVKRDTWIDQIVRGFCVSMIATPGFWIAILLLILLGVKIHLFPVGGAGKDFGDRLHHLFLPALTTSLYVTAVITRNLRDNIINTLTSEHVVFARTKGLQQRLIMTKHVLRNALVPAVTLFGLYLGWLVGGSVIMETVFAVPGMGSGMVNAILGRDYPVVQGFTLVYALLVSVVYLITDVTYSFIDPRVTL
jgi:peptide/nickel transport system permease protein